MRNVKTYLFAALDLFHLVKEDHVFILDLKLPLYKLFQKAKSRLTMLLEFTGPPFVLVELSFHLHIICLHNARFLLEIVLLTDLTKPHLVLFVGSTPSVKLGLSKDLLDLFDTTENVLLVLLHSGIHIYNILLNY